MNRLGMVALMIAGAIIQRDTLAREVRFPLTGCLTDTTADDGLVRIDCQQPTEVVDDLQKQLDALYEMRLGWGAEERCSEQYRKAREWLEKDRVKLRGQAKNLIAECNFAFSGSLK